MFFVFDGGEVSPDVGIRLQEEELDDYRFTSPVEFGAYVPPFLAVRYMAALAAREAAERSTCRRGLTSALRPVAAQDVDALRRQAQVPHDRNARRDYQCSRCTTSSNGRRSGFWIGASGRCAG